MSESKASRTLVKSPPELWSEVSSATSLQRHMDQFGEIRITKLEPEIAVAWEGEHARGTITLEASGWGTKVSLTAEPVDPGAQDGAAAEPAGQPEPALIRAAEPEPAKAPTIVPPREAVEAEAPMSPEPDRCEAQMRNRRWTRRLARRVREWLSPPPRADTDPVAYAPEPLRAQPVSYLGPAPREPGQPVTYLGAARREPGQPVSSLGPAPRGPEQPVSYLEPVAEPAPQHEAPPHAENASTAALDAALDSLGRAHHRPFSRV
jgi:hypothetical protein